jgi:phage repressor protein C with HTH and peptisase S24 domain
LSVRRLGLLLGAALFFLVVAGGAALRARFTRVAVSGHSMEPALRDGDWLVADRGGGALIPGDIVVAYDRRAVGRLLVKRVAQVGTDSQLMLTSDHPAHADEIIGPVGAGDVIGHVRLIYWPLSRARLIYRR